jgi:RluA family pseudouridine synthase
LKNSKTSPGNKARLDPEILFEDEYFLAVNKPSGVASVPAPHIPEHRCLQGQVRAWALLHDKGYKPYPLNRLDRQTSGIMLFGKFPRDREKLEGMLKDPATQKTYLALVKWVPKEREGTITFPLEARTISKKVPAVTHYKTLRMMDNVSILEVKIETGRKHQIRKHLAMIGNPLLLDKEYGDRSFDNEYQRKHKGRGQFFLHSWKWSAVHPVTGSLVEIEAPTDFLEK